MERVEWRKKNDHKNTSIYMKRSSLKNMQKNVTKKVLKNGKKLIGRNVYDNVMRIIINFHRDNNNTDKNGACKLITY